MRSELLNKLEQYLSSGRRFHELREGTWLGRAASVAMAAGGPFAHGPYLVARAPQVAELWSCLRTALATRVPLVLLPPVSDEEEKLLLAQLPATPPASAALVLFQTGSEPRAVFHSEESLLLSARQVAEAVTGSSPIATLLPAWGMSGVVFHVLLPCLRGSDLVFSAEPFSQWAAHAGRLFMELDVGLLVLTPLQLEMFHREGLDHGWRGQVISLAGPLRRSVLATYALATGRRPLEIYGMMEAAGPVLLNGRSLGAELRVSDRYELEVRGSQLFLGYGVSGEFVERPEWFRTGDIFTTEDGLFVHQARETVLAK